jgi:hypothetical protein
MSPAEIDFFTRRPTETIKSSSTIRVWFEEARTNGPRAKWTKVVGDRPTKRCLRIMYEIVPTYRGIPINPKKMSGP